MSQFHTKTYSEFLNPASQLRELFIPKLNMACADNRLRDISRYLDMFCYRECTKIQPHSDFQFIHIYLFWKGSLVILFTESLEATTSNETVAPTEEYEYEQASIL